VMIEPAAGSIAVKGAVDFPLENQGASSFKFNLHRPFVITKLLVNGKAATFTDAPMEGIISLPASRSVVVNLPSALSQNWVHMEIEYGGRMMALPEFGASPDMRHSLDDQVNSRMVELAFYSSWYPQFEFGQHFQMKLAVSLPQGWTTICSGNKLEDRIQDGREFTRWSSADDFDIVVLASQDYKVKAIHERGVDVDIYYTQLPEQFIAKEGGQIASVLNLYSAGLGETTIPNGTVRHVYSPKRLGQGAAGFARPGMIITSEGRTMAGLARDPGFSIFQGIAHEIAHYWWHFGTGQGDWINEAFAEYFSSTAVQKLESQEEFQRVIANYRSQVGELPPDAPPLSTVPISGQYSFVVRYFKGSLMLNAFRQAMGDQEFFQACREFFDDYSGKPTGTSDFRSFWKSKLGAQYELVDLWLDSPGGLPRTVEVKP
jgi:Peptidase family M1 domain